VRDVLSGSPPRLLLLDEANPLFAAPAAWKVRDWLRQVPFVVSFGSFIDDTSAHADLILPDHSFLESWVDSTPESGAAVPVATVAGPAMKPLYDTRSTPDVLLDVARRLKQPPSPPLPWQSFEQMIQPAGDGAASAAQSRSATTAREATPAAGRPAAAWRAAEFDGDPQAYPFHFIPYPSQALLDGSLAHLPWLQELPDPLTTAMWCSWVEVNPLAAERMSLRDGDIVEVASAHGSLHAPVVISVGIGPEAVAMPVGQGHETFTRYASGRGANPLGILAPVTEPATGQLAWSATRVKLTRVGEADGSLIVFAGATRERPDRATGRG
jgi:anaerobic selenocysteine-containing dehydrogenase